jgi:hypothetical protein
MFSGIALGVTIVRNPPAPGGVGEMAVVIWPWTCPAENPISRANQRRSLGGKAFIQYDKWDKVLASLSKE